MNATIHVCRTDYESGVRSAVEKTPTLFINACRYDGPVEATSIVDAAEATAR